MQQLAASKVPALWAGLRAKARRQTVSRVDGVQLRRRNLKCLQAPQHWCLCAASVFKVASVPSRTAVARLARHRRITAYQAQQARPVGTSFGRLRLEGRTTVVNVMSRGLLLQLAAHGALVEEARRR